MTPQEAKKIALNAQAEYADEAFLQMVLKSIEQRAQRGEFMLPTSNVPNAVCNKLRQMGYVVEGPDYEREGDKITISWHGAK